MDYFTKWLGAKPQPIKDSLVKFLDKNPCDWPHNIKEILFTHRFRKQTSTKYSPLFPLYNQETALLIDIKFDLVNTEEKHSDKLFDKEITTRL